LQPPAGTRGTPIGSGAGHRMAGDRSDPVGQGCRRPLAGHRARTWSAARHGHLSQVLRGAQRRLSWGVTPIRLLSGFDLWEWTGVPFSVTGPLGRAGIPPDAPPAADSFAKVDIGRRAGRYGRNIAQYLPL